MEKPRDRDAIRVVVIDDLPSVRALLRATLPFYDIQVVAEADRADAGLRVVEAMVEQPQVVILDVHMPRGSGIDAIASMKACAPGTKVLIYSSDDDPLTRARALAHGADGFVSKFDIVPAIAAEIERLATRTRSVRVG